MTADNGHDWGRIADALHNRASEVESHIPRIGELERREIVISGAMAGLSREFGELRAGLYQRDHDVRTIKALLMKLAEKLGIEP